ncbi:MAG TPA: PBP1A family penicillin-binding protein [Acidimicrobiales bacterium]|nr:PBP1A family penicillin-binding protein [Acidimicrobiales bacterium]
MKVRALAGLTVLAMVAGGCAWEGSVLRLTAPSAAQTTHILAADGTLITTFHAGEDREIVPLEGIPRVLVDAVVAVEDERFWEHSGVDPQAILRAARSNAGARGVVEGGSTITQQYIKNTYTGNEQNLARKIKEASLAIQFEQRHTKERILELYLNSVYFGNGAYGVQAAAQEYFGVPVAQVDLARAALLVGLIRTPSATDPFEDPEGATKRRLLVLERMAKAGKVSHEEAAVAAATPLNLRTTPEARRYAAPHFVEQVRRFLLENEAFGETPEERRNLVFRGGLRVQTTLDLELQSRAEEAVKRVLSRPERDPEAAVVTIDPKTGHVLALIGGRDFFGASPAAKFDLASQGRRPAGSAFKPFVLAAAMKEGVSLGTVYPAPSRIVLQTPGGGSWPVDNYEGSGGGRLDLVDATVKSSNTVYAQLILDVGPEDAIKTAAEMGIRSPLNPYPSAVLGTNDVTPLDMASAYSTLANRGLATPPTFVTRVTDVTGKVLYEHSRGSHRVLPSGLVADEVAVLQQVVQRGTGEKAKIGRPVAGKTGTGQQWRDAWFVGFTPELTTAVWVGFPDAQRSMVPPTTRIRVTGGSWPAEIWQLYMASALAQRPITPFPAPPPPPNAPDVVVETDDGDLVGRVTLDNVVGMPAEPAVNRLKERGFRVIERIVPNGEYPPGYVVDQSPEPGAAVRPGAKVTIAVSVAAVYSTVPDVLGKTASEARALIGAAKLRARVKTESDPTAEAGTVASGTVWKQSPLAGDSVQEGALVTISVQP